MYNLRAHATRTPSLTEPGLCDANDALQMSLIAPSPGELKTVGTFFPKFTYPIFGDEEKIFGYKDLKISLRFRSNDMRPHVKVSSSKKYKHIGETEAQDVLATLKEGGHLPEGESRFTLKIASS